MEKNVQTWARRIKRNQTKAGHAQNELKLNGRWIEVVKKQKGAIVDRVKMMNAL